MRALQDSFQFHREMESFGDFVRRERTPVIVFGLGFSILLAVVILLIDPAFFYPRLQTDALLYYLKGKAFAETGSSAARYAINLKPFAYAAMPGVLRSPMIRAFADFDHQLRAIQLANILILDAIALMSAYVLSWSLPKNRHWMAIAFAFCFSLLTPTWMANVFLALADAPYAAFFLASMLLLIRILVSPKPISTRLLAVLGFVFLFTASFSFRYTAPILFVLAAALVKGKLGDGKLSPRMKTWGPIVAIGLSAVLIFFSRGAILGRYIVEPILYLIFGDKNAIVINLLSLAIPSQIIPGFELGFSRLPYIGPYNAQFAATRGDVVWCVVGAIVSVVVIYGMWRSRSRFLPELVMLLAVLPVLALFIPSTARYLLTYQAFFWIWFYEGASGLSQKIPKPVRKRLIPVAALATVCIVAAGLTFGLRARRSMTGSANGSVVQTVRRLPAYFAGVTDTYKPLKKFLDALPHDRTIIATSNPEVRWSAISGLTYYMADSGLVAMSQRKDVYVVVECQSLANCAYMDANDSRLKDQLCRVGEFNYTLVFQAQGSRSRARVYRVKPA